LSTLYILFIVAVKQRLV